MSERVTLTGKTRKGKTRVGTHGAVWNLVLGAAEALSPRPEEILVRSLDGRSDRWVHPTNDPDFIVERHE